MKRLLSSISFLFILSGANISAQATETLEINAEKSEFKNLTSVPFDHSHPGRGELLFQRMRHALFGQNILPVRQILGIGPEYRGRQIQYVVLRAATAAGRGQAQLVLNGQAVGRPQVVGMGQRAYYFRLPAWADEIGHEVRQIQLHLRGNFFVSGVGAMVSPGWGDDEDGLERRE